MSMRPDKRRETIVALTHTEIMLVLAAVILLLLLARDYALTKAGEDLAETRERVAILEKTRAVPPSEAEKGEPDANPDDKVLDILVEGGIVDREGKDRQQLGKEAETAVSALVDEKRRKEELDRVVDEVLTMTDVSSGPEKPAAESPEDKARKRKEGIKRMSESAAIGDATRDALGMEDADAESVKERIAELMDSEKEGGTKEKEHKEEVAELRRQMEAQKGGNLRDKIGCVPCWLGEGKRKYYFSYDVTYGAESGSFQIKPHGDWKFIGDVNGKMSVLKDYPKGALTNREFRSFGERVNRHKIRAYGPECRLAVRVNDEADGKVIKIIRDEAGFCPIYK